MTHMLLGSAQGAVGSLLGRLSSALVDEAQQLGSVRSDIQFIKDEMESMNGFLLHVAEATGDGNSDDDHQIQAWMKQVAEVAYASQNCVDLYVQSLGTRAGEQGLLRHLRRLTRLVWSLPTRHRIAKQIQELKIRSREVGERRLRYGVEAPASRDHNAVLAAQDADTSKEQEDAQRGALAGVEPPSFESFWLVEWIRETEIDATRLKHGIFPRVIALVGDAEKGAHFVKVAFEDPWVASFCSLDCMAWIQLGAEYSPEQLPRDILKKLGAPVAEFCAADDEKLLENLEFRLRGKKFLIVLDNVQVEDNTLWKRIEPALPGGDQRSLGSAILVTTDNNKFAFPFNPYEIYQVGRLNRQRHMYSDYVTKFYLDKAVAHRSTHDHLELLLQDIFAKLDRQIPNCKLFLYALYANPDATQEDLQSLSNNLKYLSRNNHKEVLRFLYKCLPSNCKNCLLCLGTFPEKTTFRRATLVKRWAAEAMITRRGRLTSLDEAKRCFRVLVAHGYVMPKETDVTGKVKTYVIHDVVAKIARHNNSSMANLMSDLSHRLPIRSAFQLQQAVQQLHENHSNGCWKIQNNVKRSRQTEIDEPNTTKLFLELLPLSTHWGLLEVLDLEDCKDLKDYHMKNICVRLIQLKYLSLRNTGITKLPIQIDKLQYLETLDIRQTKVKAFATNSVVLPKLKHLLAGHQTQDDIHSKEPFFTVQMPKHIEAMTELQVLSHAAVSGRGNELIDISSLLQLKKLGLVLHGCQKPIFRHLYHAIGKLSRSLLTLSIKIIPNNENAEVDMGMEERLLMPPRYLQKLEISGPVNGLLQWVQELRELTKITLGKITSLSYLWLGQESCSERTLTFSKNEFQCLKFLIVECSHVTVINFGDKATPKLKKIVCSSRSQSLNGIEQFPSLKVLRLTGNFDLERVCDNQP